VTACSKRAPLRLLGGAFMALIPLAALAQSAPVPVGSPGQQASTRLPTKEPRTMPLDEAAAGAAEMKAAQSLTTKVLAIGGWTAKATPENRPPIMPSEARDTMRLMLAGKIDQWFAKTDGSGAVFLMNVTDPAEAQALLAKLPLGQAGMMTFELIPVGPLWPLGLLLREPAG
jgi:hypothetical protein